MNVVATRVSGTPQKSYRPQAVLISSLPDCL